VSTDLNGKKCLIIGTAVARRFGQLGVRQIIVYSENSAGAEAVATSVHASDGIIDVRAM
jgi:NAD(P)-dependent dehydrogenase (short-subunit alcohol dehydrogenase family)